MPSKTVKLIQSIKVTREYDEDADSSYLGKYATRADSEFAIDRAHDVDCTAQTFNHSDASEKLARVFDYLDIQRLATDENDAEGYQALDDAQAIVDDAQQAAVECDCSLSCLSRGEYQYFNPAAVEPFDVAASWIPAEIVNVADKRAYWFDAMKKNAIADYERMEALKNGDWNYIGIRATAEIVINGVRQTLSSAGLWGTESDSDESYLREIEDEEIGQLRDILHGAGFSKRAIATAVKDVHREYVHRD